MPDERTVKQIYEELVSHPFFPILFIGEAVKTVVVKVFEIEPAIAYTALAFIATIMWAISDKVNVDVEIHEEKRFWK